MSSEEYRVLIPQYLLGHLTPDETANFESRLAVDPVLRAETEDLRTMWESLPQIEDAQPSAALRTRFYERLASATEQSRTPRPRLFGLWPMPPAWQAVITDSIFAAG